MLVCLSEDRGSELNGLRLAVASLLRHCPDARVVVYRPDADAAARGFFAKYPTVQLITERPRGAYEWNCKPQAMMPLLEAGEPEVIWFDSDLLVARDCRPLFVGADPDTLILAEDQHVAEGPAGTRERTQGWGLPVGRAFERTLNTCVLRVTPRHLPLLRRWQELLSRDDYRAWQARPLMERPYHARGDQDVLNALLGSAEFSHVPVKSLKAGREVLHCHGVRVYTLSQRLRGLFHRVPPLLHGQGPKPWVAFLPERIGRDGIHPLQRLSMEVSPYLAEIRGRYRTLFGPEEGWLNYRTWKGRILTILGLGHFALRGMPLALAATLLIAGKRLLSRK